VVAKRGGDGGQKWYGWHEAVVGTPSTGRLLRVVARFELGLWVVVWPVLTTFFEL
jgi:hypothetical protein